MREFITICCKKGGFNRKSLSFPMTRDGIRAVNLIVAAINKIGHPIYHDGLAWGVADNREVGEEPWKLTITEIEFSGVALAPKEIDLNQFL